MLSLFIAVVGPSIDHHFAERLPWHSHLFERADYEHMHTLGSHTHTAEHTHDGNVPDAVVGVTTFVAVIVATMLAAIGALGLMLIVSPAARRLGNLSYPPPSPPPNTVA